MRIVEVKYLYRRNLGNYEHEEIGATAVLEEGDSEQKTMADLKSFCREEKAVTVKRGKKNKVEESGVEAEQGKVEEAKEVPKTITPYDRENDLHKRIVADFLNLKLQGWKKNQRKAKEVSLKMHGASFLDVEGKLVKDFEAAFLKEMS